MQLILEMLYGYAWKNNKKQKTKNSPDFWTTFYKILTPYYFSSFRFFLEKQNITRGVGEKKEAFPALSLFLRPREEKLNQFTHHFVQISIFLPFLRVFFEKK